ncbi:MAG: diaminopimelate decarboxylase [Bdellovibrionota bacterium]
MAYFYRDRELRLGNADASVRVADVAYRSGRPTYVYDLDDVEMRFRKYRDSFAGMTHTIHYAMKANSNPKILAMLARVGAGVDTVSAGEIKLAVQAGIPADRIIFSGVAKTERELEYAIGLGIKQVNVESPSELRRIAKISRRLGRVTDVAFRMNPDVDAKTHPYITTGFRENKFGMDESFVPELLETLKTNEASLRLRGLTMHIGSLLFDLAVLRQALEKICAVHRSLASRGFQLDRIDVGGGLGIRYETDDATEELAILAAYGKMVRETLTAELGDLSGIEVLTEPGRMIVARSGLLVSEVQYVKRAPAKTFLIVDTGMHHLLRPALYQAKHRVLPLKVSDQPRHSYDVVGPICESSDVLAKNVELSEVHEGELIALADAGAYGFAMANTYNAHELPDEVVVAGNRVV